MRALMYKRKTMEHKGTAALETKRLLLRKFSLADAEAAFKNWTSSDNVTKFLRWRTHSDISVTVEYIKYLLGRYDKPDSYDWVITLKGSGEPIGSIGAVDIKDELGAAEIGYCIGENWWRQGYTSEALAAVIRFFFEEVGANRVWSEHDVNNPNSGKVMLKCGMKYEGTLRQANRNNTGLCDTAVYGILAKDYKLK